MNNFSQKLTKNPQIFEDPSFPIKLKSKIDLLGNFLAKMKPYERNAALLNTEEIEAAYDMMHRVFDAAIDMFNLAKTTFTQNIEVASSLSPNFRAFYLQIRELITLLEPLNNTIGPSLKEKSPESHQTSQTFIQFLNQYIFLSKLIWGILFVPLDTQKKEHLLYGGRFTEEDCESLKELGYQL